MSFLRSLANMFRRERRPVIYLVGMTEPGGASGLAAFRRGDDARRFVIDEARRRADLERRSGSDDADEAFIAAYQRLNNSYRPGEFWCAGPINLAPSQGPVHIRFNEELFDLSEIGQFDANVASVTLPGLSIWEGEALTGAAAYAPNVGDPPPDSVESVHVAVEILFDQDISCFVFDDLAAVKRFTTTWHGEDHEPTDDFRAAFRGLNEGEDSAFSLITVRLGRAQLTPIFNDRQRAEAASAAVGFCALSDTRIGQSLTR